VATSRGSDAHRQSRETRHTAAAAAVLWREGTTDGGALRPQSAAGGWQTGTSPAPSYPTIDGHNARQATTFAPTGQDKGTTGIRHQRPSVADVASRQVRGLHTQHAQCSVESATECTQRRLSETPSRTPNTKHSEAWLETDSAKML